MSHRVMPRYVVKAPVAGQVPAVLGWARSWSGMVRQFSRAVLAGWSGVYARDRQTGQFFRAAQVLMPPEPKTPRGRQSPARW